MTEHQRSRLHVETGHEQSETRFRRLVESVKDYAIFMLDPQGHIVSWNAGAERIKGYRAGEIIGKHFSCFYTPADQQRGLPAQGLQAAAADGQYADEGWRVRADGSRFWAHIVITPLYDDAGHLSGFAKIAHDATERRTVEQALRRSRDQLAIILHGVADGIIMQDTAGRLVYANTAAAQAMGYPDARKLLAAAREGLLQQVVLFDEDGQSVPFDQLPGACVLAGDHPPHMLLRYRAPPTGDERWVNVKATPVVDERGRIEGAISIFSDLTVQMRAYQLLEQRVQERTRELTTLLQIARAAATTLDLTILLDRVLDHLGDVVAYTSAAILTAEEPWLVPRASHMPEPQEHPPRLPIARLGPLWEALMSQEALLLSDLREDTPLALAWRETLGSWLGAGTRASLIVPMLLNNQVIGLLALTFAEPGADPARHIAFAQAIVDQVAVAIERVRLVEQARALAALDERQRLARDLHDAVTQTLFSASLIAEVLPRLWARDTAEGERRLDELRELTRGALAEMRTLLLELRPAALTTMRLGQLLRELAMTIQTRAGVPIAVVTEGEQELPPDVQVALYRIAQEALNNVARHAGARHASVMLRHESHGLDLRICDDGRGFDPAHISAGRLGLGGMRERAASIGARLTIESRLDAGTQVLLRWPVPRGQEGEHE